jgi:hypothetical protein
MYYVPDGTKQCGFYECRQWQQPRMKSILIKDTTREEREENNEKN